MPDSSTINSQNLVSHLSFSVDALFLTDFRLPIIIGIVVKMQRQRVTEEESQEMSDICLAGYQGHRNSKSFQLLCGLFLKYFIQQRPKKSQETPLTIFVCSSPGEKGGNQSGQSFIMGCLLYLFLRYRYLKITFEVGSKNQTKPSMETLVLSFSKSGVALNAQFYNKIASFIQKKCQEHRQTFNFFGDICFKLNGALQPKKNAETLRLRSYSFFGEFYTQLNAVLANRPIHLTKNLLYGFQNSAGAEIECFRKIIELVGKIFILTQVWVNVPIKLLMLPDVAHSLSTSTFQQQKAAHSGFFKQFQGTTLEYLQKLVLAIHGQAQQIACISQLLQKTPNLSHLELLNIKSEEIQLLGVERLLQSIIKNNPLIKRVNLIKFRIQNIEEELLYRLYVNCPFLIQLSLGIVFKHSIMETYWLQNSQNKQTIELQRSKQIILQAMRLRNITLHNSELTAKLLLKKGYSFVSALQIIDCIEPVCL